VLADVAHSGAAIGSETLPDPLAAGWRGQPVCVKLHETTEIRVLRCTFPPGVGHERHFHPRHFGYALAGGTMEILDQNGTRRVDIAAGSYFSSEGIDWHEGLNVGDTVVQYLMIEPR
jgi:quercetin dioxygenase-like cupin family protein